MGKILLLLYPFMSIIPFPQKTHIVFFSINISNTNSVLNRFLVLYVHYLILSSPESFDYITCLCACVCVSAWTTHLLVNWANHLHVFCPLSIKSGVLEQFSARTQILTGEEETGKAGQREQRDLNEVPGGLIAF